jgi:hypothetical protein
MVNKKQFGKFQSGIVVIGIIVIVLVIALSLFGSASGAFHLVQQPSTPPAPLEPMIIIDCIQGFVQVGLECVRDSNVPISDIFGLISTILNIPFQLLVTIAVLIIAVIIAIPIILIARRKSK